jgi:flagellar biosynthesis protein FliP
VKAEPGLKPRLQFALLGAGLLAPVIFAFAVFFLGGVAEAQTAPAINVDLGTGAGLTERVVQLVGLMTVLSLAPSIVIMTTSFVRIIVVLSLLRTALGHAAVAAERRSGVPGPVPERHRHGSDLAGRL